MKRSKLCYSFFSVLLIGSFTGCFDDINGRDEINVHRPVENKDKPNSLSKDFDDFEFEAKTYKLYIGADGHEDRDVTESLDEDIDSTYAIIKSDPDSVLVGINGYQLIVKDQEDNGKLKKYNIRGVAWTPSYWVEDTALYNDDNKRFVMKQSDTRYVDGDFINVWTDSLGTGGANSVSDKKVFWANDWGGRPTTVNEPNELDEGIPLYHWHQYTRDFDLMKEANINTLRVYYHQNIDRGLLDEIHAKGLKIIINLNVNFNFYSFYFRQRSVRTFVEEFRDHPAILMWMIGNEWDLNKLYSFEFCTRLQTGCTELSLYESAQLVREAAMFVRKADGGRRPIGTSLGSQVISKEVLDILGESIDVIAYQKYEGLTFGTLFDQHRLISEKPMMLSEFGADSWDSFKDSSLIFSDEIIPCTNGVECDEDFIDAEEQSRGENARVFPGSEDRDAQALALSSLINLLKGELSSFDDKGLKPCVGGIVFSLTDEYWKGNGSWSEPNFDYATWAIQEPLQIPTDGTGPYPDKVYNEEFWGILELDRDEKPAYQAVKEGFADITSDEDSDFY